MFQVDDIPVTCGRVSAMPAGDVIALRAIDGLIWLPQVLEICARVAIFSIITGIRADPSNLIAGASVRGILYVSACVIGALLCNRAGAWGADGHRTVGALAEKLLEGSPAAAQVRALLGPVSMADAAIWADCVKAVKADVAGADLVYVSSGRFPECSVFETPQGQQEMVDFVRRNLKGCMPEPGEEDCHRQYHYTDINLTQPQYRPSLAGARDDDVVAAIGATVRVLKGLPAPPPFDIKDKREALLMLAHYVGDIHQPLHVGSVYLDAAGKRLNPDKTGLDPSTSTRGGNELMVATRRLHSLWDDTYPSQKMTRIDAAWLARARAVPATATDTEQFAAIWATESLRQSREVFRLVTFAPRNGTQWEMTMPADYPARMALVKKAQLTAAGAHLAEVLKQVWP